MSKAPGQLLRLVGAAGMLAGVLLVLASYAGAGTRGMLQDGLVLFVAGAGLAVLGWAWGRLER